jgi:hypothetical protein
MGKTRVLLQETGVNINCPVQDSSVIIFCPWTIVVIVKNAILDSLVLLGNSSVIDFVAKTFRCHSSFPFFFVLVES